jgi:two-component system NtrC family sensor kinase
VARTASLTPTASSTPALTSLAALADVAARLGSEASLEDVVPSILETVRRVLSATECALWLNSPRGIVRAWTSGEPVTQADEVTALLPDAPAADAQLYLVALESGMHQLGALSLRRAAPLSPEERVLIGILANLLGPFLSHAERSRQLAIEVELRTRQIEEQRRFTERIIDSLPVGLYVVDRDYRIHAWNRKRETGMQGVSRDEAIGRTIFEILHRQPAELLRGEFDDVFQTGRIQQFQMESSATGETRTFRISKIPMRLTDAEVTHVITIGEDVTEWREAMDRFAQAEKLAAIGQLAAGVMHEINNPLATIAACAESLSLRVDDMRGAGYEVSADFSEYLHIVDSEVHRCKRIVDGLLDFSRPRPATKTSVNINTVIEQTLFLLKHHARFKKLTVNTELTPEMSDIVRGNPEQLVQVFMALLLNAVDAMEERGTIVLRTRLAGADGSVVAEVIDDGHGVPRSEVQKIFEPFYTTKAPGRGTGLGLSICYAIISEHGGRIEVDTAAGKGSVFRIVLPITEAAA